MTLPYYSLLHGNSIFQPTCCYVLLRSAQQGYDSLVVSPPSLASLTVSRRTTPSGGAALQAGMPHHDIETSLGTGWQNGSH